LLAALVLSCVAGCGGGSRAKVTGTATRGGKPVANLAIHFVPEKGARSFAKTDENGKFTMILSSGEQGVAVGKHKVWVQLPPAPKDDPEQQKQLAARQQNPDVTAMLRKYGSLETTPLEMTVTGNKVIDLTLD
jgi:hypothetical protein